MIRLLAALTLLALPATAAAQTVGDRAVGMGGAYVALADDLSALWYNPAGLVHIPGSVFTASASAYQVRAERIPRFMDFEAPNGKTAADFKSRSINVFPSTLIYGLRLGDEGLRHAFAGGVLLPKSDRAFGRVVFQTEESKLQRSFDTGGWVQDYHAGPGYAVGTTALSAGVGALLRLHDREYGYNLFQDALVPGQPRFITARVYSEQYQDLSLLPMLGVQWRPTSWLQLGLVGVLPAVKLWGQMESARVVTAAGVPKEGAPDAHVQIHEKNTTGTVLKTPLRALLGIGLLPAKWLALELTLEYSGALEPHFDRQENLRGSTEIEHTLVQKEAGLDFRLGGEVRLSDSYRVRAGFYTRRAHHRGFGDKARPVSAAGDAYCDVVGLNLGLGVYGEQRRTSYGLNVVRGKGEALGFLTRPAGAGNADPGTPLFYSRAVPVDLDVWQLTVVVSGTVEGT